MFRAIALISLLFTSFSPATHAAELDRENRIRPELLASALAAAKEDGHRSQRLVVVDYSIHSRDERLFVVNLETGDVTAYRVSHGLGSDPDHDGLLDTFSSEPGSQASPEGAFRLAEEYHGKHGRSVRMDGLDETNITARSRAIVIHSASYAEPDHLSRYGKLGRSNGCIVFSRDDLAAFLDEVPTGTLIFVGK